MPGITEGNKMIVTINGKDTWRPNFAMARKSETCREFFTEIYFYGCDDYGLSETEMARLADAIKEEFYDAAKYICDEHGLDAEKVFPGLEAGTNKGINRWAKDTAVSIENENVASRPAHTMERLWDEIYEYIDAACRTGGQALSR